LVYEQKINPEEGNWCFAEFIFKMAKRQSNMVFSKKRHEQPMKQLMLDVFARKRILFYHNKQKKAASYLNCCVQCSYA